MWDTKSQNQFKGVRRNTPNVEKYKTDVNVSEMQNPVDFYSRFQPRSLNFQSPFLTVENV